MSNPEKNWFQLTVRIQSSVIPAIMPRVILFTTLGMVISLLQNQGFPLPTEVFSYFIFPVANNFFYSLFPIPYSLILE